MDITTGTVRIGVDIGGTFTDYQILAEDLGEIHEHKTPTTPSDPSIGLLHGLKEASARFGFPLDAVHLILHGTTIATNAVLEDKLPPGGLITTGGFEDTLEIGRHIRRDVFALHAEERRLLIPRARRRGVPERIAAGGDILVPLDEEATRRCFAALRDAGARTIAVCFLHGFTNPVHERRVREIIAEIAPDIPVSLASDISPEIREYERTSTTALNALLMPIVRAYVDRLAERLEQEKMTARVLLVQSNGGTSGPEVAGEHPARLLLSGPCGGALAVERIAATLDEPNLIGMDIGGTSCDISLIVGGRAKMVTEGFVDGCSVRLPMVDIRTIGTGGGSIAWLDGTDRMRVGPRSAGAEPGPACYGRGGTEPTVTDANLLLGRLDRTRFLGGAMDVDPAAARAAVETRIASPLGLEPLEAAEGIVDILVSAMVAAIRLSLFERGLDARDFALVSFGGGGGLHAALVAREIGIRKVVFPRSASTLSAYGMLWSDVVHDLSRTSILPAGRESAPALDGIARGLIADGAALLALDQVAPASQRFEIALDMRYRGQGFELTITVEGREIAAQTLIAAVGAFHARHQQQFSHAAPGDPVEVVTVRVTARGLLSKPPVKPAEAADTAFIPGRRPVYFGGAWTDFTIQDRQAIGIGETLAGPAIVEDRFETVIVPPGWTVRLAETGDLIGEHLEQA